MLVMATYLYHQMAAVTVMRRRVSIMGLHECSCILYESEVKANNNVIVMLIDVGDKADVAIGRISPP